MTRRTKTAYSWSVVPCAPLLAAGTLEVSGLWWPARPFVAAGLFVAAFAVLLLDRVDGESAGNRLVTVAYRLSRALRAVVIVAAGTYVAEHGLSTISLYFERLPIVSQIAAAALRLLKIDAGAYDRSVAISTLIGAPSIPMTWVNAGIFSCAAVWCAFVGLRIVAGRPPRAKELALSLGVIVAAGFGRLILALALALHFSLFVDFEYHEFPVGILASPLLQVALIALFAAPALFAVDRRLHGRGRLASARIAPGWALPAIGAAAFVTTFLVSFDDPGARKPGRVMIDEGHSRWEPVEPRYDTDWYGFDSGYNYAVITDFIRAHYEVTIARDEITDASLREIDVLVVKIPTRIHTPSERQAIDRFVRNGGGLFLVGEHTNVWGSGFYLNQLARPYGFEFRYDVVFDLRSKFEQRFSPPRLGAHPSIAGIDTFVFAVSCSIKPLSPGVRPTMRAGGVWSLGIDYGVSNFYPSPDLSLDAEVGPRIQLATRHVGRGRVAGFTDSTVWSNFAAMHSGKPELALGIIEWLNRRNRLPDTFPLGRFLALAVFVSALLYALRWPRRVGAMTALTCIGGLVGTWVGGVAAMRGSTPPVPSPGTVQVAFIRNDSYEVSMWGFAVKPKRSYSMFYQWVMREGMFPRLIAAASPLPPSTRLVTTVLGESPLSDKIERQLRHALDSGIPVLLLARNEYDPTDAPILHDHGLVLSKGPPRVSRTLRAGRSDVAWDVPWTSLLNIEGGRDVLTTADGEAVMRVSTTAPLFLFVGADIFTDDWMGEDQGKTPDANLRRLYELEFAIISGIVRGDLDEELRERARRPLAVRGSSGAGAGGIPIDRPAGRGHDRSAE